MSELKKKCFWAHQQLTVTTTTTTTGKKILFLFKISYFPSCSNMNMNGRRIFKMIQDFAYNVAENFGIYDMNDNEISGGNEPTDTKQRITEIGGHIPIFGRPETVFDPNTSQRFLTSSTTTVGTEATTSYEVSTSRSLFSDNYDHIRQAFRRNSTGDQSIDY